MKRRLVNTVIYWFINEKYDSSMMASSTSERKNTKWIVISIIIIFIVFLLSFRIILPWIGILAISVLSAMLITKILVAIIQPLADLCNQILENQLVLTISAYIEFTLVLGAIAGVIIGIVVAFNEILAKRTS